MGSRTPFHITNKFILYLTFNFQPKSRREGEKFERCNGGDINIFIDIVAFTIEFTRKEKIRKKKKEIKKQ